ncbi:MULTISPECIES: Hpt domain-containing protein [unclassified Carboxylicivirga]|uniref:Hpt domain-containing protein n=1 Tax=Carboxylicivirga TaxID=1628153 RepID=UPI003D3309D1
MPNPYTHIDLSYLESITDGSRELIKELINIFIEQIPEFKEGFAEGLENKDWSQIAALAHKAKSSVMSMGMEELGNKDLKNLELLAKLMRIDTMNSKGLQNDELVQLQKSIDSYPEERRIWLNDHKNEETVKSIIEHINQSCDAAVAELQKVLEN